MSEREAEQLIDDVDAVLKDFFDIIHKNKAVTHDVYRKDSRICGDPELNRIDETQEELSKRIQENQRAFELTHKRVVALRMECAELEQRRDALVDRLNSYS